MSLLLITIALIVFLNIVIRELIPYIIGHFFSKGKKRHPISFKFILIDFACICTLAIIIHGLFLLLAKFHIGTLYEYIIGALSLSVYPTYNYVLQPFVYKLVNKKKKLRAYEAFLADSGNNYNVFQLDSEVINIYAAGVLEKSKSVLICKGLVDIGDENMIRGLLFHEVGHLKKNHLWKLYLSAAGCYFIYLWLLRYTMFHTVAMTDTSQGLLVTLNGALFGGLSVLVPGWIQKKLELEADSYAAEKIGKENYINVLVKLDKMTNGGVSRGGINYPTLKQRIDNINGVKS